MFVEYIYIYMNSTTPKRHAKTFRNRNIPFQLKKQNTYRNEINSLVFNNLNFYFILNLFSATFNYPSF